MAWGDKLFGSLILASLAFKWPSQLFKCAKSGFQTASFIISRKQINALCFYLSSLDSWASIVLQMPVITQLTLFLDGAFQAVLVFIFRLFHS